MLPASLFAQLPQNIQFTNYSRASGLPEEQVSSVVQDSRGFLWIGSQEGLFRYDGKNFKSWYANAKDSTQFKSNSVTVIAEYLPGKILLMAYRNLWEIDIANHKMKLVPGFSKNEIASLPIPINEKLWQLNTWDSIFLANERLEKLYGYPIADYFEKGSLVVSTNLHSPYILLRSQLSNRFYIYDYERKKFKSIHIEMKNLDQRSTVINATAYDAVLHRLYLSNYFRNISYIDLDIEHQQTYASTAIQTLTDGTIRKSILLNSGLMLQVGDQGLYISDFKNKQQYSATTPMDKPPLGGAFLNIIQGRDSVFWLSSTKGFSSFSLKPTKIQYWRKEIGLPAEDELKTILKAQDGYIYALFTYNGLYKINPTTNAVDKLFKKTGQWWQMVTKDSKLICVGGGEKLIEYDINTKLVTKPAFLQAFYPPFNDLVTLVHRCKNGDLWYSMNVGGGLVRYNAALQQYTHYSPLANPPTLDMRYAIVSAEDSKGNIWFGTNKTHTMQYWHASTQKFKTITTADLMPTNKVVSGVNFLHIDKEDNVWVSLNGVGIVLYNSSTKKGDYLDLNNGLPTAYINSVVNDAKNRIWMGSAKGLSCYLPATDKVVTFTTRDGLPEDELEGNGIFFDTAENRIYIGGRKSIASFNPDSLLHHIDQAKPMVYIEDMQVNGKPLFFDDEKNIQLKPDENNLSFNFVVADLERNNQLIFEYQLSNGSSNAEWIAIGEKRNLTFNALGSGKYLLNVRTKYSGAAQWAATTHPFSFEIATPWYKTWWFLMGALLAGGAIIWYMVRIYYLNKLQQERAELEKEKALQQERTRIATDMHDDFGANLSRIKFISEKIQLQSAKEDATSKDLSKISLYSDEMAQKMNEIVWALNQRYDTLDDLVSFSRAYAAEFLSDKQIEFAFMSHVSQTDIQLKGETRRNVFLILKESLHNIYKHAQANNVTISFREQSGLLQLVIKDDGRGIEFDAIRPFSNGLTNMKKRAVEAGGTILVENEQGTKISLQIPLS
jgi:signal transduction histidine kinase